MKSIERVRIMARENLTEDIVSLWVEVPFCEEARAGQFVSFYLNDPSRMLPRPISICEINRRLGALRFVFRVVGEGTAQLSRLKTGDEADVIGPLGNGYSYAEASKKRVLLIGGGLGVPPMLGLARELLSGEACAAEPVKEDAWKHYVLPPKSVTCAIGYRHDTFLYEEFKQTAATFIATDDGTSGIKGTAIDAAECNRLPVDLIFACGPKPMLRAVKQYAAERKIRLYVSMEEHMACGVGACLGCVCRAETPDPHYHTNYRRVCKDGPVFDAEEVIL